jgi:hypothetical protein
VILFNQDSKVDLRNALRREHLTLRLVANGIPVTFAPATLTAVLLLPVLPSWEAVCLAVIAAPIEVALIDSLLEDQRIPEQVRHDCRSKAGFYDGFALGALFAALAVASERTDPDPGRWAWFAVQTELVSVVVGGWAVAPHECCRFGDAVRARTMSSSFHVCDCSSVCLRCINASYAVGPPRHPSPCDGAAKEHLLFFDRNTPAGHRRPNRRPYTIVTASSQDTLTVCISGGRVATSPAARPALARSASSSATTPSATRSIPSRTSSDRQTVRTLPPSITYSAPVM